MMDSAETFYSSFKFDGNTEFLDNMMKRLDGLETKLAQGMTKSMGRALDSMDAFAASCLDASTDAGKLFAKLDRADQIAREMDELADSAKEVPKSLEQIAHEAKIASDRFDTLNGSADPALRGIASDADKAAHKMETLDEKTAKLGDSWGKMRNMGLAVAAATAAVGYGMWNLMEAQTANADAADESATNMGTTVDALTGLRYAADLGGVGAEELDVALKLLSTNAASGAKEFEGLGIKVQGSNGMLKSSDVLFKEVGLKLQGMEDRTMATALASQLMGRSGSKMLAVFGDAPDTLDKAIKKGQELGAVIGPKFAKDASDFQDALGNMKTALNGTLNKIAADLAPKITAFMENMARKLAEFGNSDAGKKLAAGMEKFAEAAMRAFDVLVKIAPQLMTIALKIGDILLPLAELVSKFLEIPGAANAVGTAIALAFGGMAIGRITAFSSDLMGVVKMMTQMGTATQAAAGTFETMASSTGGLAGKLEGVRGALNGLNMAAKASIVLAAIYAAWQLKDAIDGVIQERQDAKKIADQQKGTAGFARVQERLTKQLVEARRNGDDAEVERLTNKLAANRATWGGNAVAADTKAAVHNSTTYITQNNTIGADISKIGDLIGKNLEKLVRSQINIDIVSSRVVRMGGV